MKIWRDAIGAEFELKKEGGAWWHRKKGDQQWKKGPPPGMAEKAKRPLA